MPSLNDLRGPAGQILPTVTLATMVLCFAAGTTDAIYVVFAAVSIWFVWKYLTETKGRTLEQM